jgi:hypothetical protein
MTRTVIYAIVTGLATLAVSFILTSMLYTAWADWRYPQTSSMAGMSAFVVALIVAPVCCILSAVAVLFSRRKTLE